MKKFIYLIALSALTITGLSTRAQESPPAFGSNFKPISPNNFYISLPDSAIWQYKGTVLGWHRLSKYKDLFSKQDKLPVLLQSLSTKNSLHFDGYSTSLVDTAKHYSEGLLITLPNGNVLNIFRSGGVGHTSNTGFIAKRLSSDNGKTWGSVDTVFNSSYDDRNVSGGITDAGRIVLFFRQYDASISAGISNGFIYSDDNGVSWSSYTTISTTVATANPFGRMVKNGAGKFLQTVVSQGTMELFESTDGSSWTSKGLAWDYRVSLTLATNEPCIAYVGNNKLIALARNTRSVEYGYYQFTSSDNGESWTYVGQTNHNLSANVSPSPLIYFDDEREMLITMSHTRRSGNTPTDNMYVYANAVNEVFANPTGYDLKKEYTRPIPNLEVGFYGYPTITKRADSNYLVVFTDAYVPETLTTTSLAGALEKAALYQFTIKYVPKYFGQNILSEYGLSNYAFNKYSGKYEPTPNFNGLLRSPTGIMMPFENNFTAQNIRTGGIYLKGKTGFTGVSYFNNMSQRRWNTSSSAVTGLRTFRDITSYANRTSMVSGSLRMELPVQTGTTWIARFSLYEYDGLLNTSVKASDFTITGNGTTNLNPSVICSNSTRITSVRFGRNLADNKTVVLVTPATTFRYPTVMLTEFTVTGTNLSSSVYEDQSNYLISVTSDESDFSLNQTIVNSGFLRDNFYQASLLSGINLKTVNGSSLLGSGDLVISAGLVDSTQFRTTANSLSLAQAQTKLNTKQDVLVSGTNIKTVNGQSILGSGDIDTGGDPSGYVTLGTTQTVSGAKTFTSRPLFDTNIAIKPLSGGTRHNTYSTIGYDTSGNPHFSFGAPYTTNNYSLGLIVPTTKDVLATFQTKVAAGSDITIANTVQPLDYEVTDNTKGLILKSPDGTRYRITVANGGTLTVTSL